MTSCCPIIELRQYTLCDGQRETLIDLFEREFIESQEALGISVIGQFRDLEDRNRFVWLRGFECMEARGEALTSFYDGPVWASHRSAANATMIDSDNVLLLRPSAPDTGFVLGGCRRSGEAGEASSETIVVAVVYYLEPSAADDFAEFFQAVMRPSIIATSAPILATLATETASNNFPRLPIRDQENVFIWFSSFAGRGALESFWTELRQSDDWRVNAPARVLRQLMRKPETLILAPTRRSLLR
ncbi:MAG: NIPSNAP family protein [Blastocatellia bacterium]